jgi:ribosome-associated translation inhibitor RaiA
MELSVRSRGIELTDEIRDRVARRICFALDTFADRIDGTLVYLTDLNGPRGGVDKVCHIAVKARGVGDIVVRETGPTLGAALNRAARRVKYRVSEALRQAGRPSTETIRTVTTAA